MLRWHSFRRRRCPIRGVAVYTAGRHGRALAAIAAVPDRSAAARRARFLAALSRIRLKQCDGAGR
jgi:hypothetical protein